jgi:hypothetical protein
MRIKARFSASKLTDKPSESKNKFQAEKNNNI